MQLIWNTTSTEQARGAVQSPLLLCILASETQRKISFLDLRGQTAQKSTALSSIYVPTFGRHGDASNYGKRPWRHNLRPWGTYMTTCYQSMVHVKSYLKFRACKAPLGAAGTKSRLKYSQWTCTTKLDTVASGHLPTPEPAS